MPAIRRAACALSIAVLAVFATGAASELHAQNVDWLVNLNDSGSDPTAAGGTIAYNINVANNGLSLAPATTLDLDVPVGTTLSTTSGTITGCAPLPAVGPATVTCSVPALASGASADLIADVVTTTSAFIQFGASVPTVVGAVTDLDTTNNDQTENTTITLGADIELQVVGPGTAASGSVVTYGFGVTNNGPDPASNLALQVPIPTGVSNINAPPGCSLSGGTYTCPIAGPVASGASVTFDFDMQISAASGSTVTPVGTIQPGAPTDPIGTNNSDSIDTDVTGGSDLRIVKTRSPSGNLLVGDTVTFSLAGSYTGDSPNGITITDTFPANYAIQSVSPSGGSGFSCSVAGQDVTCSRTTGAGPGANVSLGSIDVVVSVIGPGSPVNTASIAAAGPLDPDPTDNSDTDGGATISNPVVDLRANKSGPTPPLVVVGNSYSFPISASNVGNAPFFGTIVLTDSLPAGLTVTGYSLNGWSCTPLPPAPLPVAGPATIECTRDYTAGSPLAAGATTPAAVIQTTATATGSISNSVSVSSPNGNLPDANPGNNLGTYSVTGSFSGASADLSVVKTASLATVAAGDIQTFSLRVINAGTASSTNITLTDNLTGLINDTVGATGAGLVSIDDSAAGVATGLSCSSASSGGQSLLLTCSIGNLPICSGANCPTITVQVRPGGNGGTRSNSASAISSSVADPNLTNNSGSASFSVDPRADMTVTKVASPSPVSAGQDLTYVITAQNINNGLSAAANVSITDTLPDNLTFVSATPSVGSCGTTPASNSTTGPGNNTVTCTLGAINNGAQRTVTIVTRPEFATRGLTLSNTATVATTTTETDGTNNTVTIPTPVNDPVLDLLVNKIDSVDPVAVGDDTIYTISIQNIGPSAAENVVVTDVMPPTRLSYQSFTVSAGGSCPTVPAINSFGQTLACQFPRLLAGASATVTVTARATAKGTSANTVDVSSDEVIAGFDTNLANNSLVEQTSIRTKADLEVVSKLPSADPVNLRDNFDFVITIRNNTGPGLTEADNVVVADTLPAGMVLTGAPAITSGIGNVTSSTCSGGAGATNFSCDLGTFTAGTNVEISVPVEVVSIASSPQTLSNSASVSTSSLDVDPTNNSNTGTVSINASTVSGTLFRDFADDSAITAGDSGIAGVTMTLTGTSTDGAPITQTITTASDGSFTFSLLPAGTYSISRGSPTEAFLSDGTDTPGSAGGTASGTTTITGIVLGGNVTETDYLFAMIPQARIGIAKSVLSGPAPNADGSFNVTFRQTVENFSLEALQNISVDDALAGAAPLFGTYALLTSPGTDPLAPGSYTVLSSPVGSCGGLQPGFDGNTALTVASGFGLGIGASCSVDIALRVQPTVPFPPILPSGGRYDNQATVDGEGVLSGQTSATNAQLSDSSDNGADPDPNGNGQANEAGENDPTPVNPVFVQAVGLVKTADTGALSAPPVAGDILSFNFTVTNTGNVSLTNLTLTDPLPGVTVTGGPIASLAPGASDSVTFTASYPLTQADVNSGIVVNQATVSGADPFGGTVTDPSGTTTTDDTPLTTPLTPVPAISLVKSADTSGLSIPAAVGEQITYTFAITNTGNVTLSNVILSDVLPGIVLSGGPIPSLNPGVTDSGTFTAVYAILQSDIDAGQVTNQATATGSPPTGPDVSDLSGATAGDDNPTVSPVGQVPTIDLQKDADDSAFLTMSAVPGDTLPFTFTVSNTGNTTLTNITITDPLPGVTITGNPIATLAPGAVDSTTITGSYVISAADIAAGQVNNTATATGNYTDSGGNPLTVTDDDDATGVIVAIDANPEVFPPIATDGGVTTSMLASDTVANQPATLSNVTISVVTTDPALTLDPLTGLITLAPGNPAGQYFVTYQICSAANPTVCDTATETITQGAIPAVEATKTQVLTDNGDGVDGVGDTLTYTITFENTGNVPLQNVAPTDVLTQLNASGALSLNSGPTFVSASAGSPQGNLAIGETATYTAAFTLTIRAVLGGGTSNTVTATALPVFGPGVPGTPVAISDVSDNGDDGDGNSADDPTDFAIASSLAAAGLIVTKTTPRGIVERGRVVPYTITIQNDNPVVSGLLDIVDALPPGFLYLNGSAMLDGVPYPVEVAGRIVTWPDVPVPPLTTVTATVSARVTDGAPAGELVNTASARDPSNNALLAPRATATVRILPEPVFDCGDVIGKVFDDRNRDGYQNPSGPAPILDDDAAFTGKAGANRTSQTPGILEPGIPGVRLVGVDGTTITTDEFGRYHVPCAMLPEDRGSNFILKVDTRSLPAGFRLTTENPRVVRLTPGKLTEMNFGAAITRVVRVDLNDQAFGRAQDGRLGLSSALASGLSTLVETIAGEPTHLRLAYHLAPRATKGDEQEARRRVRLVERRINDLWKDQGRVKLTIERTFVRVRQ